MANSSGNAYGLTVLSPIIIGSDNNKSFSATIRDRLQKEGLNESSRMAKVPNTYLARFYVLNDVPYQGSPAKEEHLKSKYLVFSSNFYGDFDEYLEAMWHSSEQFIREIWGLCVGFNKVSDEKTFCQYIKKCQVKNSLFFNGSNDESLAEQLKGLYLKQEFSKFVFDNQGKDAASLQLEFNEFINQTQPANLDAPSWQPGKSTL